MNLYAWNSYDHLVFTTSATPSVGDTLYHSDGTAYVLYDVLDGSSSTAWYIGNTTVLNVGTDSINVQRGLHPENAYTVSGFTRDTTQDILEPTTIAGALEAAQGKVTSAYASINSKGGTLPVTQNLSNLPAAIASIPSGGVDGYVVITPDFSNVFESNSSRFTVYIPSLSINSTIDKDQSLGKYLLPLNTSITFTAGLTGYGIITVDGVNTYMGNSSSGSGTATITFTSSSSVVTITLYPVCCIPYYTPVNYFDGSTKTAENVQVGDKLLGYDENIGDFVEVEVLNIVHKLRNQLVKVTTDNYELELTPDHPILTDKGWAVYDTNAGNYKNIDKIQLTTDLKVLTINGEYEDIKSIGYRELEAPIDTYTFNITDGIDTYVAAGLISHNGKC